MKFDYDFDTDDLRALAEGRVPMWLEESASLNLDENADEIAAEEAEG